MADRESELILNSVTKMDAAGETLAVGLTNGKRRAVTNGSAVPGLQAEESRLVGGNAINDTEVASTSSNISDAAEAGVPTDTLSTCLVCGKRDRSVEFILPDRYCSQSCADKNGCHTLCTSNSSSEFGVVIKSSKLKSAGKTVNGGGAAQSVAAGKRKKKRASYLNAYEQDFKMDAVDERRSSSKSKKQRGAFSWARYLADENLVAAPAELFIREPPASFANLFTAGTKLEGIDPLHPTAYCVLTVAEVKGLRIRLHIDGYSECYDFWVNANSDQIFPTGWCQENGNKLLPPKGVAKDSFSWEKYLQLSKSTAAPRELFTVCSEEFLQMKPAFEVGDKLEAVDVKNNKLVCVASVADILGDSVLVHFDGWEETYDYWCSYGSSYIHHVGWCQENAQVLSAPNGYPDAENFTWESYLADTNSQAAPREGFKSCDSVGFEAGMVLEAVDKRNPVLVRVAQLKEVIDAKLLINFCGWDDKYDYWVEADSPEIHPAGCLKSKMDVIEVLTARDRLEVRLHNKKIFVWYAKYPKTACRYECQRTGHPLQPPLSPLEVVNYAGVCPTLGCYGYGHVKGAKYSGHHSLCGCPYSDLNLNRDNILLERLGSHRFALEGGTDKKISLTSPTSRLTATPFSQCSTPGCNGTGHVTGKFPTHFTISGCPLAEKNQEKMMKKLSIDTTSHTGSGQKKERRRKGSSTKSARARHPRRNTTEISFLPTTIKDEPGVGNGKPAVAVDVKLSLNRRNSPLSPSMIMPPPPDRPSPQEILQNGIHNSVFLPALPCDQQDQKNLPLCWDRNIKLLPGISNLQFSQVPKWSPKKVSDFVKTMVPTLTPAQKKLFVQQQLDGDAFLMLKQMDIVTLLKLKLGPAIKVYNSILVIKKALGR